VENNGWIGVDLDGTLAHYDTWEKWNVFGPPIRLMVNRVRKWLDEGKTVKIFTARVTVYNPKSNWTRCIYCYKSNEKYSRQEMVEAIQDWCSANVKEGWRPGVTCVKDLSMVELWDDRAVGVETNTGRTLADAALEEEKTLNDY
jgi:hypothetical protein